MARPAAPASAGPAGVSVKAVTVAYGGFTAVRDFSLNIPKGSFVTLLGPSGCGKTTVLRAIAGLAAITSGEIGINGRRVDTIPIHKRDIGLVFQNYALFPHKSVFDNVAFGLKYRNLPKADIARRVAAALDMVRLPGSGGKLPSQLSGGQQQRIALARAIVFEPDVLLMDEPLSALDANMREEMRVEIRKIQRKTGITAIFVTHDQDEALSMSDQIVVMNSGRIEQIGPPQEVFEKPGTLFVAGFLGKANMIPGIVRSIQNGAARVGTALATDVAVAAPDSLAAGAAVTLLIRPQKIRVGAPGENTIAGTIVSASYLGGRAFYEVECNGSVLRAETPSDGPLLAERAQVILSFDSAACSLLAETDPDHRPLA